jgi:O-antigen ligase
LPLVLTLIFIASKRKKIFFYYFLLIIFLLAIIFSGSRGVWAAALGIFIFLLFAALFLWRKKILYSKQHLELIIGCLILFFLLFPLSSRLLLLQQQIQIDRPIILDDFSLLERAKSIFDLDEISVRSRLEIWQKTLDSIIRYPLLGVGIGNYTAVLNEPDSLAKKGSSAHSLYLNIAAETGIFALLIIMAAFFQIIRDNWRVFSKDKKSFFQIWSGFFILALLWALCYSLFDVVLLNDKVILFFLALLGILYAKKISLSID